MASALRQEGNPPSDEGPAAGAEGPVFADPVLQEMYDAAEPMPGDE